MKNIYDIWLSNIDVSNSVKLRLIEYFKESKKIWEADKKLLLEYGFKEMSINKILDNNYNVERFGENFKISRRSYRSTFCISCRCRRGRERSGRSFRPPSRGYGGLPSGAGGRCCHGSCW